MPRVEELHILAMVDKHPRTPLLMRPDFQPGTDFAVCDIVDVGCNHDIVLVDLAWKAPGASDQSNEVRPALRYELPNHPGCLQIPCFRWRSNDIYPTGMGLLLQLWTEDFSFSSRIGQTAWRALHADVLEER